MGLVILAAGCATSPGPGDVGLEGLDIDRVDPGIVVPGTQLVIEGASFIPDEQGAAVLRLVGDAGGESVDVDWPARFVDYNTMTVEVTPQFLEEIGGDVDFEGDATIEVRSLEEAGGDGELHVSPAANITLQFRRRLTPEVSTVLSNTIIFVNDRIAIDGEGFLLGGTEGDTVVVVDGCFDAGSGCQTVTPTEIVGVPRAPFARGELEFPFKPSVAGIQPGSFSGRVTVMNRHSQGDLTEAAPYDVSYEIIESQILRVNPTAASLGQYVFVEGGGFVGGTDGGSTDLHLVGTYTPTGAPQGGQVDLVLIPEFVDGNLVRYVVNEDDELGRTLDLRRDTGTFVGTIRPVVTHGGDSVTGEATSVTLAIAPVKQVVYINFMPTFVEGLRSFGLRAVNTRIRERVIAVAARAYEGVNIEFRTEPPTDYKLYAQIDLVGEDPQNSGLFGYDNTPGKDNGNERLYDRIGGVNAATQMDGYPGFGGVFVKSLLGFSLHPPDPIERVPGADPVFDHIFDEFRPDRGEVISAADLGGGIETRTDGDGCPASNREDQVSCAIFVFGNLVGGTMAHELGHSLGLANPFADGFHNAGDAPNRLMDSGGDRPFLERAELMGQGPGVFCDEEYSYLRMILPSADPPPSDARPSCY